MEDMGTEEVKKREEKKINLDIRPEIEEKAKGMTIFTAMARAEVITRAEDMNLLVKIKKNQDIGMDLLVKIKKS